MVRFHSPWTEEEIELLKKLKSEGMEYKDITRQLPGRSISGVKSKAERLGLVKVSAVKRIKEWGGITTIKPTVRKYRNVHTQNITIRKHGADGGVGL